MPRIFKEVNLVPRKSTYLVLALACSLALLAGSVMANPDPAPEWNDLAIASNYGHVDFTFNSGTNTFNFTVFNDQTGVGQKIGGWAVYPTAQLNGFVPTIEGPPPTGWIATGWEGPVTGLVPQFGNIRSAFVTTSSFYNVAPLASKNGFSIRWIGSTLPTDLAFGVEVVRPSGSFWAQAGLGPCAPPVPDANTLVLAGSGVLMALSTLRRRRRVA